MSQTVSSPQPKVREVNFCAANVDPYSVFGRQEVVHSFNPARSDLAKLLVMCGAEKSFRQAYLQGWGKPVPEGWFAEEINGVGVYIYNPEPVEFLSPDPYAKPDTGDAYEDGWPPWF